MAPIAGELLVRKSEIFLEFPVNFLGDIERAWEPGGTEVIRTQ